MLLTIVTLVLVFLLLCSGSALCCAMGKGRFEDALPLTCTLLVLVGFVFGVFNLLLPGFFVTLASAAAALFAAFFIAVKNGAKAFCKSFFTPGFFIFAGLYLALFVMTYGLRLAAYDEFSHWGDIVKVMTTLNSFGTNPLSESMFPAYPPAMALFQYAAVRLHMLLSGERMAEWLLFFAYQVFMFSMYFPFIKRLDMKKPGSWLLLASIWLLPMVFQRNAYSKIYIDSFLSTLLGLGLAHVLCEREGNGLGRLNLIAILVLLPLTKSIGLFFAVGVLVLLFMREGRRKTLLLYSGAAFVPWGMWKLHVALSHVVTSSGPSMAIAREHMGNSGYTMDILTKYLKAMVSLPVTHEEALFPQLPPLLVLAVLMVLLWLLLKKEAASREGDGLYKKAFFVVAAVNVLFFIAMGLSYMYIYPDFEATVLLGIERYLNNMLMADAVLALMLIIDLIARDAVRERLAVAVVLITALLFTPVMTAARFVLRRDVAAGQALHSRFEPYYETLARLTEGENCDILFASDGSEGIDYILLRTELRPSHVELSPLPENIERFDYVVIYNLASPPEGTENGGIYEVVDGELIKVN